MAHLDPRYVIAPLQDMLRRSQTNVLLGLRLVEKVGAWPPPTEAELTFARLSFGGGNPDLPTSKASFKTWLLQNGLRDIHQSIRVALDRMYVFGTVADELKANAAIDVAAREEQLTARARSANFPKMVQHVTTVFGAPIECLRAIESFNQARNCLEHANGLVVARFCTNPQKDTLTIHGRRFRLFFKTPGGVEVDVELGKPGPENSPLLLGAEDFEIPFLLNDRLDLSLKQFVDILNTCVFVCADVELKLKAKLQ